MKAHTILLTLLLITTAAMTSSALPLNITAYSGAGLPVTNITVTIENETTQWFENLTDLAGNVYADVNGTVIYIRLDYPSSAYSAKIDYVNGTKTVFLNDVYGLTLRLVNTLGQPLEAQDCSVAIYRNDTNSLIKAYDTSCKASDKAIDNAGNWYTLTSCPLTDSGGYYHFTTIIKQEDGFEYGVDYTAHITCNAQTGYDTFAVDVQKPPDVDMMTDFIVRYGGALILGIILLGIVFVLVAIALLILRWGWKKRPR